MLLPRIIVIVGPTASGKTELAVRLAKQFNGEIISADSRQLYRELNIATGKPAGEWQNFKTGRAFVVNGIPHHLMDLVDPGQTFTVADYKIAAEAAILEIVGRGRLPFLVGGTGLYIQTVVDNWRIPSVPPNQSARAALSAQSLDELVNRLLARDAQAAQTVDLKNRRRVERALEVALAAGASAEKLLRQKGAPRWEPLLIGLGPPPEVLRARIIERVNNQFAAGLVAEAEKLLASGYAAPLPGLSSIGYPEVFSYRRGELTDAETRARIFFATYQYAKRQLTWFKRDGRIKWLTEEATYESAARKLIADFVAAFPPPKIQSFRR